jgi:L-lactate utilization protein LutC
MYSLVLIIFVVSEKKAFEHFPIGSNVNLCIPVLQDLVAQYRNTPHTSLKGMIPRYVSNTNVNEVILYLATRKPKTNINMSLQRKQKRIKPQYNKVK